MLDWTRLLLLFQRLIQKFAWGGGGISTVVPSTCCSRKRVLVMKQNFFTYLNVKLNDIDHRSGLWNSFTIGWRAEERVMITPHVPLWKMELFSHQVFFRNIVIFSYELWSSHFSKQIYNYLLWLSTILLLFIFLFAFFILSGVFILSSCFIIFLY